MPRSFLIYLIAISLMVLTSLFSLLKGSTSLPFSAFFQGENAVYHAVIWKLRLPRTLAAFTSGALLSLSGALIQLLLQNPLADPYVLGISGGAALCTLLLLFFSASEQLTIAGAWLGSLLAIFLILLLAKQHRFHPHSLLLSGIALACGFSACISFILLLSPGDNLHNMIFWLSGDLSGAQSPEYGFLILVFGLVCCYLLAPGLNLLARGDQVAQSLGLNVKHYRFYLYLLSSLFAGTAVTLCGCIGFVGLIIPHLTRRITGLNHKLLLPISCLFGGSLLMAADTFARSLFAPMQLPVGILLAFIGVPIFIWLLQKPGTKSFS